MTPRLSAEIPRWSRLSLRGRLLVLIALASLPTVLATIWLSVIERREAVERTREDLRRVVIEVTARHEVAITTGIRLMSAYAMLPDVISGSRDACERTLKEATDRVPEVFNPTRTSSSGIISCNPGRTVGVDVSQNQFFIAAMATDSVVIGEYRRSETYPEPFVPINVRLKDPQGRAVGVLSLAVRMQWLNDLALRATLPEGSVMTLVNHDGEVLARLPARDFVGQRLERSRMIDAIRGGERSAMIEAAGMDGVRRFAHVVALPAPEDYPVAFAIGVPLAAITADADHALRIRLTFLIAAIALAILLARAAAVPLVVRDIEQLGEAADRIGSGDFAARTGVRGAPKEVQRLAETMDTMAGRLAERESRQLQAQKLESLGRLAGGIAHDFNNLLTAIQGHIEIAQEELPPGHSARESLEVAFEAARRSGGLTRQLLSFARRDSLQVAARPLGPVLIETAALLRHTLGSAIRVELRDDATHLAALDEARIEQAIVNLALNARDAMPEGGVITLSTTDVPDTEPVPGLGRRAWVRLDVEDTGTGMPPDVLTRVFEPFFTTKPMGKGTGLGLSMVYGTMQQLGGAATVSSTPGRGTTVSLWFPALRPGEAVSTLGAGAAAHAQRPLERNQGRILLVEDEPGVRAYVARLLRRAGYQVFEAENGAIALSVIQQEGLGAIDALVTDVVMPEVGGLRLAESLRSRRPDLPVVLMSGYLAEEQPEEFLRAPRTAMLEKPFEAAALLEALVEVRR